MCEYQQDGLSLHLCRRAPDFLRQKAVAEAVRLAQKIPVSGEGLLYVSVGPGGFLQDLTQIQELVAHTDHHVFNLHFIEPQIDAGKFSIFAKRLSGLAATRSGLTFHIATFQSVDAYLAQESRCPDLLLLIDFAPGFSHIERKQLTTRARHWLMLGGVLISDEQLIDMTEEVRPRYELALRLFKSGSTAQA